MNKEFEVWKQNNEALFAQPELENFQQMIRRAAEMHGDKAAVAESRRLCCRAQRKRIKAYR